MKFIKTTFVVLALIIHSLSFAPKIYSEAESTNTPISKSKERVVKQSEIEIRDRVWYVIGESQPYTGKVIDYYENGHKKTEYYLKDGYPHGLSIIYYDNGQKKLECSIFRDDTSHTGIKMEGLVIEWHRNGVKKSEINVTESVANGIKTEWDEKGNVVSQKRYDHGIEITE